MSWVVPALFAATSFAQDFPGDQPTIWSQQPDIAAFEKIVTDRVTASEQSIKTLISVKGTRTLDNTLLPYDETIRQLDAAGNLASLIQQVHPDATFRDRATAMYAKVSAAQTELSLNRKVYQALAGLKLDTADKATRYYVNRQLLEFRLAGVNKNDATRARLKTLQDRLTEDQSNFDRNISDDTTSFEVSSVAELAGMPKDYIDRQVPDADGKIRIKANEPNRIILDFADNADVRRRYLEAWGNRAYPKNRDVLLDMMQARYEIAQLLGYASWADYNAADKMIGTGNHIDQFINEIDTAARPLRAREYAMLLAEERKLNPAATQVSSSDESYVSRLLQSAKYDFDEESVRPYLPYDEVKQGLMNTAATLFHVSFRQKLNVPAWDPSVETWEVFESDKLIGRFYLDMHPRPEKYAHAEMAPLLDGIAGKQLPEAVLVCNLPETTTADPGLLTYWEATTFFHEFGHLMHHILGGHQKWAGISGISMEGDFSEAPSQMLEEWMHSPQVLASFARHYQTGETIPADLVARMNRASAFGRANEVSGGNSAAAISYDIYKSAPQKVDVDEVWVNDRIKYSRFPRLPNTHGYASFGHLAGYSSAYYTYEWDKVIAEDFFQQFDQDNLLAGDAPLRYRHAVLDPGGSMSANDLVRNFLGREPNTLAFQKWMGEEFADEASSSPEAR